MQKEPGANFASNFYLEPMKDPALKALLAFLEHGELPAHSKAPQKVTTQALHFAVVDALFYFVDHKAGNQKHAPVLVHL